MQARLTMAYKIINNKIILGPEYLPKSSTQKQRPHRTCNMSKVGAKNHLIEPKARLQVIEKTFFYSTPKLWNETISETQAKTPSVDSFKKHFEKE